MKKLLNLMFASLVVFSLTLPAVASTNSTTDTTAKTAKTHKAKVVKKVRKAPKPASSTTAPAKAN